MIPVYYVDTSVIGGYFDAEFRQPTRALWSGLLDGRWHAVMSTLTIEELVKAPGDVRLLIEELPLGCRTIVAVDSFVRKGVNPEAVSSLGSAAQNVSFAVAQPR